MSDNTEVSDIATDVVDNETPLDLNELSLEALILLINSERLKSLEDKSLAEFKELQDRQKQVSDLHNVLKAINAATTTKGELDITKDEELKKQLKEAKALGVDIKEDKLKYNKEERERLVDNIRMTIEDLNVKNDMQLQTTTRLTNERYESYQMARAIMKPLDEDKKNKARQMKIS